jgi:hypothetical protein
MSITTLNQTPDPEEYIRSLPGLIATVCTTGMVLPEYAQSLQDMRSYNDRNGFHKVEYMTFDAKLVEAGRDAAALHALENNYAWMLQIDADASPFRPDALHHMLGVSFVDMPYIDVLGAYAQLNSPELPLPTIDTGTGTWEVHYPHTGILRVIRTGGHFILAKTDVFRKIGPPPWFRTRRAIAALEALAEVDSYARCHLDGTNPFWNTPEWQSLYMSARSKQEPEAHVGEDSGFCDRVTAAGGYIAVDTSVVAGHTVKRQVTPDDLRKKMRERMDRAAHLCGQEGL